MGSISCATQPRWHEAHEGPRSYSCTNTFRGMSCSSWLRGLPSLLAFLDCMQTPRQRGHAAGAQVVDQARRLLRFLALVPRVVDHDHRRAVAGAKALHFEEREGPGRVGLP